MSYTYMILKNIDNNMLSGTIEDIIIASSVYDKVPL